MKCIGCQRYKDTIYFVEDNPVFLSIRFLKELFELKSTQNRLDS